MSEETVVIVNGARTPMGGLQGGLASVTSPQLGSVAIAEALSRAGVAPDDVDEVFMGCVLPAGLGQSPARQALLGAGLPKSTGAVTLNKVCGSGMQAAMFAHDSILAGTNKMVVAGGMESMTNAPHLIPGARGGVRSGHKTIYDHMFLDGLENAYDGRAMGSFAQQTADDRGITREQMDAYAIESLRRAKSAIEKGLLKAETVPVTVKTRKGEVVVEHDEQPFSADETKIPKLRPAFAEDGTVTAANSSSISDGASALVLTSASEAEARGLKPMAKILGHSRHSHEPGLFTTAPIGAINKLLDRLGWTVDDVDLWEINEAFAMVVMMAITDLGLDPAKVNVYGGGCAMGHPIGSTGSRIIVTLMYALQQAGKKRGIASLCIGGGEATAIAIELL
ncbi:acetyl-CoA C-acyltransferase [Mangrovimicrobium sediminis]|uniref:Acetyl-CoA C-acyltransferase n=1 Tax=Mangrovimicrobium sediminis TaxID=2562682 RepID=A0A4Z0M6W4_9GAMM|nr:acetyl-CoA C-acyltransferase [Haliea sp. SAOS-164]TGD75150.1 acetyl-CoA C-acyltransferase [Haliea sp. SAOS-164]